jgi:uncharacterized protein
MKRSIFLVALLAGALEAEPRSSFPVRLLLEGAYVQVGKTASYDGSYRVIPYPGGDVPIESGACTDVLIRAYRHAGIDLQVLVHEDMSRAFRAYPRLWGLSRPDRNIDHRRVPNLATFLRRHGVILPASHRAADYEPGDIVTWRLSSGLPHIGIVSDRTSGETRLMIHNVGEGVKVEDVLFQYEITGHYRYPPDTSGSRPRASDRAPGNGELPAAADCVEHLRHHLAQVLERPPDHPRRPG